MREVVQQQVKYLEQVDDTEGDAADTDSIVAVPDRFDFPNLQGEGIAMTTGLFSRYLILFSRYSMQVFPPDRRLLRG